VISLYYFYLTPGTGATIAITEALPSINSKDIPLKNFVPLDAAKDLRENLIQYAADTKDHTVSDRFVQLQHIPGL
jgi:hypothetical protein